MRHYRNGDPAAIERFAAHLPAAANRSADEISALQFRLHDAQSCVARDYGFGSWADLSLYVAAAAFARDHQGDDVRRWLALGYGGHVTGGYDSPKPRLAAHLWNQQPERFGEDLSIACAVGYVDLVAQAISAASDWINRPPGPFKLPPLIAVTPLSVSGAARVSAPATGLRAGSSSGWSRS